MYSANDWKAAARAEAIKDAQPLTLPSGMTILARRPDPMRFAMLGQLPAGLIAAEPGAAKSAAEQRESGLAVIEFLRSLLAYCCVKPRISTVPAGEDEIHPSQIPDEDAAFILSWAQRREEAAELRSFRGDGGSPGAGVHGADVGSAAERAAGD